MARDLVLEISGLVPEKVAVTVKKDLTITEDVDYEVDTAAATFGYYGVLAEKAETRYQKMKFAFESWQAEAESREASDRERAGKKPHSVARMDAFIKSQPKNRAFQLKLIEFEEHRRILKVLAKAFETKAGMVQTKASNRRAEVERRSSKER